MEKAKKQPKLAIMLVHGIGRQAMPPDYNPAQLTYSSALYKRVMQQLKRQDQSTDWINNIAWHEVNYAHVFNDVQARYFERLGDRVKRSRLRQMMIENFGDAAAYRLSSDDTPEAPFERVHACVETTLDKIEAESGKGAPLLIIAHSLGGQVMADYMRFKVKQHTGFKALETLRTFITFGCNIPLFHLGDAFGAAKPPEFPGKNAAKSAWWINLYDRDDILGYPLAMTGAQFQQLALSGQLIDIEVNAGSILSRWNTLSHLEYWKNPDVVAQIAACAMDEMPDTVS